MERVRSLGTLARFVDSAHRFRGAAHADPNEETMSFILFGREAWRLALSSGGHDLAESERRKQGRHPTRARDLNPTLTGVGHNHHLG